MKKLLSAIAAAIPLTMACSALADDYNWQGSYVGANAGWGFGNAKLNTSTVFSGTGYFASTSVTSIGNVGRQSVSPDGFTSGAQLGFNRQSGNIVYGFEGGLGYFDNHKSVTSGAVYPCCGPTAYSINQTMDTSWLLTLRPRVGYATGNLLVYAAGGLSVTDLRYEEHFTDTFATANETDTHDSFQAGWNLGAGAEYALMNNWSVNAEYMYTDFGNQKDTSNNLTAFNPAIAFPTNVFSHSTRLSSNIVRVGMNYKF
jgi:outer membrane immunogenic protein